MIMAKIIGHVIQSLNYYTCLEVSTENSSLYTSKHNAHGTFWNLHININLKIDISETDRPIELKF